MNEQIKHTDECAARDAAEQAAVRAWGDRWPDACDSCKGHGGAGSGSSAGSPGGDYDPCPDCTERGICSRCGAPGLTSEERGDSSTGEGPCTACGWNYNDAEPRLREDPCGCELAYMERAGLV